MAIPLDPRTPAAPTFGKPKLAVPKVSYVVSAPAAAKKAAAPNTTGGSLFDVASSRAATETDALVAGYQKLQDYANQQAALRATQQGQLGLATSRYLEGLDLPGRTTSDYAAAAAAQRSAAAGYSGGLQQTVSDAAAQVQAQLAAGGSPQTAYNPSEAAGNALYALGGALPGTQFGVTGPTVAAGLRALPAQALGYGQMLAFGELGQGQQEAAKFNVDIVTARAKQGALAGSYMDTLLKAQQDAQDAAALAGYRDAALNQRAQQATDSLNTRIAIANQSAEIRQAAIDAQNTRASAPKVISTGGGIYAWNPDTRTLTTMKEPPASVAGLPKLQQFGDTLYQVTPTGLVPLATKDPEPPSAHWTSGEDAKGQYSYNTTTDEKIYTGGPSPSSAASTSWQSVTLPNGKVVAFNPKTTEYRDPVTGKTITVKEFTKPKPPKPPKPYHIPVSVLKEGQKMATSLFTGGGKVLAVGGVTKTVGGTGQETYWIALDKLTKYLRALDVPVGMAARKAKEMLAVAGYTQFGVPQGGGERGAGQFGGL